MFICLHCKQFINGIVLAPCIAKHPNIASKFLILERKKEKLSNISFILLDIQDLISHYQSIYYTHGKNVSNVIIKANKTISYTNGNASMALYINII